MENEFELALAETFASLTSIAGFGGLTLSTSDADLLQLTVGEFLDLLGFAEEALRANQPQIQALLSNPTFTADLDAETRAFLQDWAAGDYSFITSALDEARAELSGVPRETLLINVEGFDGDGGTLEDDFQLAFDEAEANRRSQPIWMPKPAHSYRIGPLATIVSSRPP